MRSLSDPRTSAVAVAIAALVSMAPSRTAGPRTGDPGAPSWLRLIGPDLRSADVLTFGPSGTLFVGDSRGSAVFALDVGDTGMIDSTAASISNLDDKLAGRLGTTARDLAIKDM